eukprot:6189228-Pleurochrysis_carterae.AAC.1
MKGDCVVVWPARKSDHRPLWARETEWALVRFEGIRAAVFARLRSTQALPDRAERGILAPRWLHESRR